MTSILNNINICSEIPQNIKIILKSLYVFKRYSDTNIIIITKEDKVYVLGVNYYGLLGLGDIEQVYERFHCKYTIHIIYFKLNLSMTISI